MDEDHLRSQSEECYYLDTYANLLYKLGRTEEAIIWEQKAFSLAPNNKDITDNLDKMKKGEPT